MAIDLAKSTKQSTKRKAKKSQPTEIKLSAFFTGLTQKKLDVNDRIFFTEQLSLMLETGMPLFESLKAFATLEIKPQMKLMVDSMLSDVEEGKSFSAALSAHPGFFSLAYIHLVAAAENGGFLDKVLVELTVMDDKREKLKATVISAMIYPGFLILFSIAVVIFVLVAVFPKFAVMFERIHDELPGSTLMLMAASNALINHWWIILAATIAIILAAFYWMRTPQGREVIDNLKLSVYVIKDIFIQLYLVQSMRLMSMSMANGVTVMDTLDACSEVVSNSVFNRFLSGLKVHVKEGAGFSDGFDEALFIPATVKQMIKTGDTTGNLAQVMARVADYYERELEKKLTIFTRMVEPVMLLVMGTVVGLIVSSLILPIFKLSRAVG
jgi:type II secretory pathway component PulF